MRPDPRQHGPRTSARLRLALSYAAFLVFAGLVVLAGVYVVLRYVPYPRTVFPLAEGALSASQETWLLRFAVAILVGLAVLGLAGGWLIAGWVLRPLQRINAAAEIAATGRLDHRIRLSGRNDEFRQLADTFDHMLDRLGDAFTTQERFAANASHELRTPLSVTATMLEVARAHPEEQDYSELIERLSIMNDRTIALTQALLRLSDANAVTATSEPVDLASAAQAALDDYAAEAGERCIKIDARLGSAPTMGDLPLLRQLAGNLVQNAIRHNDKRGELRIVTGRYRRARQSIPNAVALQVTNTGRHYSVEEAARLAEPFLRGAGRVAEAGAARGYGLGLALVERITSVHGGRLVIAPRAEGGLVVTVVLPGRSAPATEAS